MADERLDPVLLDAKRRVSDLVRCPVDWESIIPAGCGELFEGLLLEWSGVAEKHSTYGESDRFYAGQFSLDDIELERSTTDLVEDERRIKQWIDQARAEYRTLTAPFANLHIDRNKFKKHRTKKKMSRQQIIEETIGRTSIDGSLFFSEVKDDTLEEMMWFVIGAGYADAIEAIKLRKHVRLVSQVTAHIGASRGHSTDLICWDISFAGSGVHPFPILPGDVPSARHVGGMPDLFDYLLGK